MGTLIRRHWLSQIGGPGLPRRDRRGGSYSAYVPDQLVGRAFTFDGLVAADIADAERAINRLDTSALALSNTEALARLLLRAEAVASSHIEGLSVSPQRLLRVGADIADGIAVNDTTAIDVLANVDAMNFALEGPNEDITVERLIEVHRRLLENSRSRRDAGMLRTEQNWIGGSSYNPLSAAFVPPPPEDVERLLADLCIFCNDESLPAVAQAGIAHAQFETIHPFADGNGRTGRALIYMVLRKRGLAMRVTPPISLILATQSQDYVARLDATRFTDSVHSAAAHDATNEWVGFFANACTRAVADAESFERRVSAIQADWRTRISDVRADATARILIDRLPETPIVTVKAAVSSIGRSFPATNDAIQILVKAGILFATKSGLRNRTFEAREIIDAFTALERQLASPQADTKISKPVRTVPERRKT